MVSQKLMEKNISNIRMLPNKAFKNRVMSTGFVRGDHSIFNGMGKLES